ncbi:MAG: DUF1345 domain-containing protein [Xenococcaceae cyanobacterium]
MFDFKHLDARPRLLVSIAIAGLTYILLPYSIKPITRSIGAWDAGAICFLSLAGIMMNKATPMKMRRSAQREDESRLAIFIAVVASACISLLAIIFLFKNSNGLAQWLLTLHITLALITIVVSWLLTHTMFALHYAHLYYRNDSKSVDKVEFGGLDFPQEKQPNYWDFLYFSFGIGMTCQVADVQITSQSLRKLTLVHSVLTFFFNTIILALSINILAGSL